MTGATSRYLLIEEVATELRFDATAPKDPLTACRKWLVRQAVPIVKRGHRVLVDSATLRAVLEKP